MTKKGPARCPGTKTIAVPRSQALIDTNKSTIDYIEMHVSVHIKGIETSIFKMTKVQNHIYSYKCFTSSFQLAVT